jgi:fructokinase
VSRVVVVGDALIDELRDERGVRELIGGAALNVAVGLARLGVPATLIAMVGDDEDGAHLRAYLRDYGVELLATPAPVSARAVSVRARAEPAYVFNDAARARRLQFGPAERAAIGDAAMTVVSGFRFDDAGQTAELADAVAGRPLVIDPNPRAGLLQDAEEFVCGFEALAAGAELVKVSDEDARLLYGSSLDALRARLVRLGARAVLATAGAQGAVLESGSTVVSLPVSPMPGPVVDTMGAGDAALAAAVAALVSGVPADEAAWEVLLQAAMDVAAATCRGEGGLLRHPSSLAGEDFDRIGT